MNKANEARELNEAKTEKKEVCGCYFSCMFDFVEFRKKTKFFEPDPDSRSRNKNNIMKNTKTPRFFDDYEHMLSVIGLIRFAMGIRENIVMKSDSYEVEELPSILDP